MSEERRTSNIEMVLVELGTIKQLAFDTRDTVTKLDLKVGVQNGRIGKVERWQSFLQGCGLIVVLLIIPIVVQFFSKMLAFIIH